MATSLKPDTPTDSHMAPRPRAPDDTSAPLCSPSSYKTPGFRLRSARRYTAFSHRFSSPSPSLQGRAPLRYRCRAYPAKRGCLSGRGTAAPLQTALLPQRQILLILPGKRPVYKTARFHRVFQTGNQYLIIRLTPVVDKRVVFDHPLPLLSAPAFRHILAADKMPEKRPVNFRSRSVCMLSSGCPSFHILKAV